MLVSMATSTQHRPPVPPASPGAAIRGRREYLGMTQEEMLESMRGLISQKLLSQLENDRRSPGSLRLAQYRVLLGALRYTPTEFEEVSGTPPMTTDPLPGSEPYRPSFPVPIAGTVSAGLQAVEMADVYEGYLTIDPTVDALRNAVKRNLVALVVNGDSMISESAALSVRPGSHVIVELGALPRDGDLVVAWIEERETAVLKQYREGSDTVLRSFNARGGGSGSSSVSVQRVTTRIGWPSRVNLTCDAPFW